MPLSEVGAPDLSRSGQGRPLVSMEGWARFEQRARQRRIEHRLQDARAAIRSRQWAAARAALDELKELDPNLPELDELDALTLQITRANTGARSHRGTFVLGAAAFTIVLLAVPWIENAGRLPSTPAEEPAAVAPAPEALLASRDIDIRDVVLDLPVPTAGRAVTEIVLSDAATVDAPPVPVPPRVSDPPSARAVTPGPSAVSLPAAASRPAPASPPAPAPLTPPVPSQLELPPATAPEPAFAPPAAPPVRPPVAPAPVATTAAAPPSAAAVDVAPATADESAQVRAVLQRYQAGYERLDAGLVHAVWPGVNEAALARAFGGLESQALDFKACYIQLRGATADVLCTGSTRYVPKVGSREPRVEQLAWNFRLRKKANDWEIETARAER